MRLLQINLGETDATSRHGHLPHVADQLISETGANIATLQCGSKAELFCAVPGLRFTSAWQGMVTVADRPFKSSRAVPLSDGGYEDDPNARAVLAVDFAGVLIVNAYLSWNAEQAISNAAECVALVDGYRGPVLIAGDFNQTPETPALAVFADAGFRDVWKTLCPDQLGHTYDDGRPRRIDFVLERSTRPLCNDIAIVGDDPGPSGHLGLLVDLEP